MRTLVPSAETLVHSRVEAWVLQAAMQSDLNAHLEPGWAPELVFQILQERGLDWAPRGHSLGDQNRGLTG
jgi:hypothetical protein